MKVLLQYETVILQKLIGGAHYGLELKEQTTKLTDGRVKLTVSRIYATLNHLRDLGFLDSFKQPNPHFKGGRPRIYYRLTAKGRIRALEERKALALLIKDGDP
jgi:DNA-binding PadR family transcriptional regulator